MILFPTWQFKEYHLFGAPMPGRNYNSNSYSRGMNGQLKDDEIAGNGNIYSAEYWEYDSRTGRRWNTDPLSEIDESPYACFYNSPIMIADPSGAKGEDVITKTYDGNKGDYVETGRIKEDNGTDTYNFRGGVLDGQKQVFNKSTYKSTWTAGPSTGAGGFSDWYSSNSKNYDNQVEAYRAWQSHPFYHLGEDWFDRAMRTAAYSSMEARREYASGGYNMFGGLGKVANLEAQVVNLEERAAEIHGVLNKITQTKTTVAAAEVIAADGQTQIWIASSEKLLRPAQRAMLKTGEVAMKGVGHAEATIINAAKNTGATVLRVAASRPICPACAASINNAGATPASVLKAVNTFGGGR